ncbi:MAG: SHOCT domain-containing protein [Clostridia bacterium]|nr:SHOCT domain-containing protein [Clostridia bacterium]
MENIFIIKKTYSYRLDEIDNIELISSFGEHNIKLNFTQGNGRSAQISYGNGVRGMTGNFFMIKYVKNYQEVYDQLSQILSSVKNEKDLMVDIELAKIEAQREQAQAISSLARDKKEKNGDDLKQLETLAEMLKAGIITQEEFDAKKKQILNIEKTDI